MADQSYDPAIAPIVRELDLHRARFYEFCRSLDERQLARPVPGSTWIVRDFISHLATIDGPVMVMFRRLQGERAEPARPESEPSRGEERERFDVDRWNDARVAQRRDWALDRIFLEAEESRAQMRDVLAGFTAAHLDQPFEFGGDSKRKPTTITIGQYLRGWCKHDVIHAVDMMRGLPDRPTRDLDDWFDDPMVRGYQQQMNAESGA